MASYLPGVVTVNVVATAEFNQSVDLDILSETRGFVYDTSVYHCAYFNGGGDRARVSVFGTGKMISVGTKSLKAASDDLQLVATRLVELGLVSDVQLDVKLRNLVVTADLGQEIKLESLASILTEVVFDPEQFPGAIYYANELEGAAVLVFRTGKVVIAGLKRLDLVETARLVLGDLLRLIQD